MKSCSYCERENSDESANCRECGTEFSTITSNGGPDKETPDNPATDLSGLDMNFEVVEGFSRPNWKLIFDFIKANVPRDDLSPAWDFVALKWLNELAADLGGNARVRKSHNFYCLSDLETQATSSLLDYAEFVVETIRGYLGKAAWSGYYGKHVLLFFSDPDDYYAYISYYHREGTHILTGGIFIRDWYTHIALPIDELLPAQHTLAHELTHNLLCHLPMPLWLNEGLAVVVERLVTRRGFMLDRDLADRHRNHWNEDNIQAFWAGRTYRIPGDDSQLSYSLGEILVSLLSEKGPDFIEFVRAADWRDAGQDAAVNFLGRGLEETVAGFLGPGDWRPQRHAIKAILKTEQQV